MGKKEFVSICNKQKIKSSELFSEKTIGEHTHSLRMFDIMRNTARSIYKDLCKNKSVSEAFLNLEREFNHVEFQYELKE